MAEVEPGRRRLLQRARVRDSLDGSVGCDHGPASLGFGWSPRPADPPRSEDTAAAERQHAAPVGTALALDASDRGRRRRGEVATWRLAVVYTDGVVDGRDPEGQEFGQERLSDFVERRVNVRATTGGGSASAGPVSHRPQRRRAARRRQPGRTCAWDFTAAASR